MSLPLSVLMVALWTPLLWAGQPEEIAPAEVSGTRTLVGTKIIGTAAPSDYPSFSAAISALNSEGVGPGGVSFLVQDGTYHENPPAITACGTAEDPITFQAQPGAEPVLAPDGGSANYGFKLDGADYVRFDNIDINCLSTLPRAYVLENGAQHVTICNCHIYWPYAASGSYGIFSLGTAGNPNSYCSFENNTITGPQTGIWASGNPNPGDEALGLNIQGNNFGEIRNYAISAAHAAGAEIHYNSITFYYAGMGGTLSYRGIAVEGATSSYQIHHNSVNGGYTNNSVYIFLANGGTSNWHDNTITNVNTSGYQGWYGMYMSGASNTSWTGNLIQDVLVSGQSKTYGAYVNSGSNGSHAFAGNQFCEIETNGNELYGFYINGGSSVTIAGNSVRDLRYARNGGQGIVSGIQFNNGNLNSAYNNMIGDLKAQHTEGPAPQLRCITVSGGSVNNIWNNSVYLAASGTKTVFATAALFISTAAGSIDLKNNILVNASTPGSAGRSSAFWKSSAGVDNLAADSDCNIYYTQETPDAEHPMGYFAGVTYVTLAEYQAFSGGRDQDSWWENAPFASLTGVIDLHLDVGIATHAEGNAIALQPPVLTDFDGDDRDPAAPDIGADEGDFTPYAGMPAPVVSISLNGPNGAILSWDPVPGADGYLVFASGDPMDWPPAAEPIADLDATSCVLTLTDPLRFYRVVAVGAGRKR